MDNEDKISFKKLALTDLELLHKWLNNPHIKEWYGRYEKSDLETVKAKFLKL